MLLDLSEIVIRTGMRVEHRVDQPRVEDPDLDFSRPLRGRLVFRNSGDLININGTVSTVLLLACSRCLQEVPVPIELQVDEHLPIEEVRHPDRDPEEGREFDTVVSSIVYLDQGRPILDLDELLRQLLVSEIPIRTLCEEECAGLCPSCGANRNEAPCGCSVEESNRPLSGLGSLLSDGGPETGSRRG